MKPEYYLISKNIGQKYHKYIKAKTLKLSKVTPYTVDEVIVGVKGQIGNKRKITTFRDSKGNTIEKAFDYYGQPYRNRLYSMVNSDINDFEIVESRNVKEYILDRKLLNTYFQLKNFKSGLEEAVLQQKQNLTHHISHNIDTGEKFLSQTLIKPKTPKLYSIHKFVEYPSIYEGHKTCYPKKEISFVVNNKTNEVVKGSEQAINVKFPKRDSYLAYRALGIDDLKTPVTERYIKERGLSKTGVEIDTNYIDPDGDEGLKACTSYFDASISFNKLHKFESKADVVNSARHEVEHIWQYALDGRLSGGVNTPFASRVYKIYGPIKNKALKKEAKKCSDAIENYVEHSVDYKKYYNNYIEKRARKAGEKAELQYIKEGAEIRKNFPHIPEELL